MRRAFLILMVTFGVLGLWSCSDTSSSTDHCTKNEDCTNPEKSICKAGICVAEETGAECESHEDCTGDEPICRNEVCVADHSGCSSNEDCSDPNKPICENKVCVAEVANVECASNDDCTDPLKFICKDQKCIDPSEDFTPENYKVTITSPDDSYTEEELTSLKDNLNYGFLRDVGNKEGEYALGTNFNPNHDNILRLPLHDATPGMKYTFDIDFRDSSYTLPEAGKKAFSDKELTKGEETVTIGEGVNQIKLTLQNFRQAWPDEPRLRFNLFINADETHDVKKIYYAVLRKNTVDGAGYVNDPEMLGYYDFHNGDRKTGKIGNTTTTGPGNFGYGSIAKDDEDGQGLAGPRDKDVEYYFVLFIEENGLDIQNMGDLAKTTKVIAKPFTSFYERSKYEDYAIPVISNFVGPERVLNPSMTVTIDIPESMRNIENLHLQWANSAKPIVVNPDVNHGWYPSDAYVGRWGYYYYGIIRGQKNVVGKEQVTIEIPTPKRDSGTARAIFWFTEGTQSQSNAIPGHIARHTRIKKQAYDLKYDAGAIEAWAPAFINRVLNFLSAEKHKVDSELVVGLYDNKPSEVPFGNLEKNTMTWSPAGPDGSTNGEILEVSYGRFYYATYSGKKLENGEGDWNSEETKGGFPHFFYPQITYTMTSTNVLKNGNTESATKDYRANYKGCDAGKNIHYPATNYFPGESPANKEGGYVDLAWTNPADVDIYEIRIQWTETSPNPNIAPKKGVLVLERFYDFNQETGKLTYGVEPTGTIKGGEWSPKKSFPELSVY